MSLGFQGTDYALEDPAVHGWQEEVRNIFPTPAWEEPDLAVRMSALRNSSRWKAPERDAFALSGGKFSIGQTSLLYLPLIRLLSIGIVSLGFQGTDYALEDPAVRGWQEEVRNIFPTPAWEEPDLAVRMSALRNSSRWKAPERDAFALSGGKFSIGQTFFCGEPFGMC